MSNQQKVTYLPIDRAVALMQGKELSEEQTGTALLADVSGFSSLAEALRRHYGDQKGAELLILHLNAAFEALIAPVHFYGGSVISFSGDAITCWFDSERCGGNVGAAGAALMAAVTMRTRLGELATIPMPDGSPVQLYTKNTLASGVVQRWVLGIPAIQLLDTISGLPVDRLSEAEKLAEAGQILADRPTVELLSERLHIVQQRGPFAVIEMAAPSAKPNPWPLVNDDYFSADVLGQWLLPSVAEQIDANISSLTELRMTVALFLRFTPRKPDAGRTRAATNNFIQWAQRTINTYGGNLLQVTFGDKGSYLYAAFGAPVSYSDNALRAVETALVLRQPPDEMGYEVQIGVSTGLMRTGSYGAEHRHTYGVQGDEVNVAARLMMHAGSGQALISGFVMQQLTGKFSFAELQAITVKGQPTPVEAAVLQDRGYSTADTITMQAVTSQREGVREPIRRTLLDAIIASVYSRGPRLLHLTSEAGMGKTYLTAAVRKALESELPALWLTAPCDEILKFPLGPFKFLVQHYFRGRGITVVEEGTTLDAFYEQLRQDVRNAPRLPDDVRDKLLAEVGHNRHMLRFFITHSSEKAGHQTQQTINFDALSRELLTLLRAISVRQPLVIHLQDGQMLDPDSQELTARLLRSAPEFSITVILSSRTSSQQREQNGLLPPSLERFPHETLVLEAMTEGETRQVVEQWLDGRADKALIADIYSQSHGNPLFARLLIDHLRSRGHIELQGGRWRFSAAYDRNDMPGEIQTHLVARIDRLGPRLKSVIQSAAVLGVNFDAKVLEALLEDADTPLYLAACADAGVWTQVTEQRYEFTQSLLRTAAYTMLGQERQVALHRAAAHAGLKVYHDDPGQLVEFMGHMRIAEQRKAGLA